MVGLYTKLDDMLPPSCKQPGLRRSLIVSLNNFLVFRHR